MIRSNKQDTSGSGSAPSQHQVTEQVIEQVGARHKAGNMRGHEITFFMATGGEIGGEVTAQVTAQVEKLLGAVISSTLSREELQSVTGIKHREHLRKTYLEPLITSGWIERTIPDKPTSSLQKYRVTEKGRTWLAEIKQ
ncbi:MAG: hypothetical protein HGA46_07100 [Chlorobiaceae bacterium]|nr:hypothetical protein [Chlorobiaceae bacterium]